MKITDFTGTHEEVTDAITSEPNHINLTPSVRWQDLPVDKQLARNLKSMGYDGLLDHQLQAFSMFSSISIPDRLEMQGVVSDKDGGMVSHDQFNRIMLSFNTSAGKTVVGMLFIDKKLRESDGGKAVYCVPYKALADEMAEKFKKAFNGVWNVGISTGDYSSVNVKNINKYHVIIVTYDKLNSLLRKDKQRTLHQMIHCVVLDELHLINTNRGSVIEDVVMKLIMTKIPVMALSATVGNRNILGNWLSDGPLKCVVVHSEFRPVKLKKGILVHCDNPYIEYEDGEVEDLKKMSDNAYVNAAINFLNRGLSVLMFRQTRGNASSTAGSVAEWIRSNRPHWRGPTVKMSKTGHGEMLTTMIQNQCAFHHAGVERSDKNKIEHLYRNRQISFVSATTTLSTGINLPATVGIIDYNRYDFNVKRMVPIPKNECLQCMGRVGRPQYDSYGIALILFNGDKKSPQWTRQMIEELKDEYLSGTPDPIQSSYHEPKTLVSSILGAIAGKYATTVKGMESYLKKSLAFIQFPRELRRNADDVLYEMEHSDYPLIHIKDRKLNTTKIGNVVNSLYIHPKTAYTLLDACKTLPKNPTDLAIVFHAAMSPDFRTFYPPRSMMREWADVLEIRSDELCIGEDVELGKKHVRAIMTAMILVGSRNVPYAWARETDKKTLERQWLVQAGDITAVTGRSGPADWVLHAFSVLAKIRGRPELSRRCEILKYRIRYGIKEEIIPLARIRGVGRVRGRSLYKAGYRTPDDVANAGVNELAMIIVSGKVIGTSNAKRIIYNAGMMIS